MKLSDTLSGLLLLVLGAVVVLHTTTFPSMPGQSIGPSVFPMLTGAGLALIGVALMFSGLRARTGRWIEPGAWVSRPRMVVNFVLVVLDLIFYAVAVQPLGFFITAPVFLCVLFVGFRATPKWIVPLALVVPFAVHYAFYTLLRVPLPWGLLEGIAW